MVKLEEIGARMEESVFLGNLATLYFQNAQFEKARETYESAIAIYQQADDQLNLAYFRAFYGALLAEGDEIDEAARCMGLASSTLKEIGDDLGVAAVAVCEGLLDVARARQARLQNEEGST